MKAHSLYLHIPFCVHRCGYCDFNTYAGQEDLIPAYMDALAAELRYVARHAPTTPSVVTVFFGGGTPSLVPAALLAMILDVIRSEYELAPDAELSLEANPGSLGSGYLDKLREAGFNRLSLGMQSATPEELLQLERQHTTEQVIEAVKLARQAGFDNLNLDLIFALPGQSLASWQRNLDFALRLDPEHLSLYALTIEHGTPFQSMAARGLLPVQDPDLAADMYEWAQQRLETVGYEQYEISNWAKRNGAGELLACRHNLQYWRNDPYIGLGAGAHGFLAGMRIANCLSPSIYIERMQQGSQRAFPRTPVTIRAEQMDAQREMGETMMMGLRLVEEGISLPGFEARFGAAVGDIYPEQIKRLMATNLLEQTGDRLRLTGQGRLLGNQVFMEFV